MTGNGILAYMHHMGKNDICTEEKIKSVRKVYTFVTDKE